MTARRILRTEDFMGAVRAQREAMGLTHSDVDHLVGWQDAYCSKVEGGDRTWGKRPFSMTQNAADLLQALGLAVVVMPVAEADRIAQNSAERRIDQKPRNGAKARKETRATWTICHRAR